MASQSGHFDNSGPKNPLYALSQDQEIQNHDPTSTSNRGATLPRVSRDGLERQRQPQPVFESKSLTSCSIPGSAGPSSGRSVIGQNETETARSRTHGPTSSSNNTMVRKPSKSDADNAPLHCPQVNCKEKIVICFDISSELTETPFRSRSGEYFSAMELVKRALNIFLKTKHAMDHRHEFALILFDDSAQWVVDFTSNPNNILKALHSLTPVTCGALEMGTIFDEILRNVPIPHIAIENPQTLVPSFILRTLFIYGRSHSLPTFMRRESLMRLQSFEHYFYDAFYVHERPSDVNSCEDIYNMICEMDDKGLSYIMEVSHNPTKLYDCMARLLAHPLQRPLQGDADHNIEPEGEPIYM